MLIRCSWHGGIIGEKPPFGGKHDSKVTDGICPECEAKYFGQLEIKKEGEQDGI